jgi:DNA polymerase sigma
MSAGVSKEIQDKIVGILKVLFPGAQLYLFGSRPRRTYSQYSDIDCAMDMQSQISLYDINEAKSM